MESKSIALLERLQFFGLFLLILLLPAPAHAYIDPGTGSALVYIVTGIVLSVYFAARGLVFQLINFFSGRQAKREHSYIAIHSEDPRYEITFLPIIRQLAKRGVEHTYYTMYKRDPSFENLPEGCTHKEISPGIIGYAFLNKISANVLVTTTPQLDIMTFRRSKHVKHYCMVQHALGEAFYMRPFAYDYFDSVLCCGYLLTKNIRKLEKLRNRKPKKLYETGVPHYDELLKKRKERLPSGEKPTVLIAPSWGELSLFNKYGTQFIGQLAGKFEVIVRPHPQMKVSQPAIYHEVTMIPGVEIDTAPILDESLSRADLLLSDFSGIIHEFAFIHEKPVIVADFEMEMEAFEGHYLQGKSEIAEVCREFLTPVKPESFDELENIVFECIEEFSVAKMRSAREQLLYHFGNSGEVAATQIVEIAECQ